MKPLLILGLALSLAANGYFLFRGTPSVGDTRSSAKPAAASAGSSDKVENTATAARKSGEKPLFTSESLAQLRAGDARAVTALREAGLPEKLIRALVRAEIDELYRARENALYADPKTLPYWDTKYSMARYYPKDRLAMVDLRREKEALLTSLLGPDHRNDEYAQDMRFAFLPPGKVPAVSVIEEEYDAMMRDIRGTDGAGLLKSDREKLAYLEREKRNELAQYLSPSELEEYELRNSSTGQRLRYALNTFQADANEFKVLYNLFRDYEAKHGRLPMSFEFHASQRSPADVEFHAQARAALGEQRYAEYERSRDFEYMLISNVAERLALPAQAMAEAHRATKEFRQRFESLSKQGFKSGDELNAARVALGKEFQEKLVPLLGEKGYAAYSQQSPTFRFLNRPLPQPRPRPQ